MKKVICLLFIIIASISSAFGQKDSIKNIDLNEIVISGTRSTGKQPFVFSNIKEEVIKANNPAKNIPAQLQVLPSIVSYTEGGTAVGNTSLRIRGTDASRINVTINGMPLNDPETQEAVWVDLPDLSNSLKSIQVQRGVGTSTNGGASFGGSISMETLNGKAKPYADVSSSFGQYNTWLGTIAAGTGIMKNGFSVDARYSAVKSDGYIRNGKVDHRNLFINLSHCNDKQLIRLVYLNGIEHTGITWQGCPLDKLKENRRYNPAGEYVDDNGIIRYYQNETDNYYMNILQLLYSRYLSNHFTLNGGIGYTNGYGYYEDYRTNQSFGAYGLPNQIINNHTKETSDLISREYLSNNYYLGNFNVSYHSQQWNITAGGMYGYFKGLHYGRLIWEKYNENISPGYKWYNNIAHKQDNNLFAKANYTPITNLNIEAEIQQRLVNYTMSGIDNDLGVLTSKHKYNFINPKLGFTYYFQTHHKIYAQFGISNREPLRSDLKVSVKNNSGLRPERLFDYEAGYQYRIKNLSFNGNLYFMNYKDQFVPTGKLNEVGYKLQENVAHSYRTGIELEFQYKPIRWFDFSVNTTLSSNKIKNYTAYFDYYDNATNMKYIGQISEFKKSTDIAFSPDITGAAIVSFEPIKNKEFKISLINKYVGQMYYDNTSNENNSLPAYFVTDFTASYCIKHFRRAKINLELFVNNITNTQYCANAWVETIKFADHTEKSTKGLFPQAGINALGRIRVQF